MGRKGPLQVASFTRSWSYLSKLLLVLSNKGMYLKSPGVPELIKRRSPLYRAGESSSRATRIALCRLELNKHRASAKSRLHFRFSLNCYAVIYVIERCSVSNLVLLMKAAYILAQCSVIFDFFPSMIGFAKNNMSFEIFLSFSEKVYRLNTCHAFFTY